jgi:hypothetical protein
MSGRHSPEYICWYCSAKKLILFALYFKRLRQLVDHFYIRGLESGANRCAAREAVSMFGMSIAAVDAPVGSPGNAAVCGNVDHFLGRSAMTFAKRVVVAALLGLGLMSQAFAVSESKVKDLGLLTDGQFGSFFNTISRGTSFTDYLNFSLSGPSDISGVLAGLHIRTFSATLTSTSGFSESFHRGNFNFDDLAGGNYTMAFSGIGASRFGGAYGTIFSVTAVPEADTWLMILIGAGLVAFQLRRKQKTLRHRPLTSA